MITLVLDEDISCLAVIRKRILETTQLAERVAPVVQNQRIHSQARPQQQHPLTKAPNSKRQLN